MATEVIMPVLGMTMESGVIVEWAKKEGEPVREGEVLFSVETDKSVMDVEAKASGVLLKILNGPGDSVPIQQVIGYIGEAGERVAASVPSSAATASTSMEVTKSVVEAPHAVNGGTSRIKISPKARKHAASLGLSIDGLQGTGPGGRIVFSDVEAFAAQRPAPAPEPIRTPTPSPAPAVVSAPGTRREANRTPLTGIRKVVATRLAASASTIPHFFVTMDIDMTRAAELRQELLAYGESRGLARVSYNDMMIKAAGLALRDFPAVNASLDGHAIVQYADIHVGFAVALDHGLVVPVVANADRLSVFEIAGVTKALESKAKNQGLAPADYGYGTFTISNLGMFGVDQFTAIINPPEAAILAVGRIRKQPVALVDEVRIRSMVSVTLSSDHRLIDGAVAARFLGRIRDILEQPLALLIQQS